MSLSYRNQKNAEIIAAHWKKPLDKPEWFSINNMDGETPEIFIYDAIGWPYNDVGEIVKALATIKDKSIKARINSPGGDVFDGFTLHNAFASHPGGVDVEIEGLAASISSVIAMGGRTISAYHNSMMMIHNSWTIAAGSKADFMETADLLGKIDENIIDSYTKKTKTGKKEMRSMLDATTWMNAKEMKEKGFIDNIIESGKAKKAQFDLSIFANCPAALKGSAEPTERDIERILRDAGVPIKKAKAILAGCRRVDGVDDEANEAAIKALSIFTGR